MKKVSFVFICIFITLFFFSCYDESLETEKVEVINKTNEVVSIYYYDIFDIEMLKDRIRRDETRFIYFQTGKKYYARGDSTGKEYGWNRFVKVPSNYDVQQTWEIR